MTTRQKQHVCERKLAEYSKRDWERDDKLRARAMLCWAIKEDMKRAFKRSARRGEATAH